MSEPPSASPTGSRDRRSRRRLWRGGRRGPVARAYSCPMQGFTRPGALPRGGGFGLRASRDSGRRREVPGRLLRLAGTVHHAVVDAGPEGSGTVVFTSGLGGAWYDWDSVVPLLAGRATLVRFD